MVFLMALLALAIPQEDIVEVEGQPLAANVSRLAVALEFVGAPLPPGTAEAIKAAGQDAAKIQQALDPLVLLRVHLNPESRVKVARGRGEATLLQGAFTPILVKVVNESTVKSRLNVSSPQSGQRYEGGGGGRGKGDPARFLQVEMFANAPMTGNLSGLKVEYALALIYSIEAGKREATITFDVGQGTQDLGFRAEAPVLFDVRPGVEVKLKIRDFDGKSTTGRFTFRDRSGRIYPPQAKRLAPDFFFQQQVYRHDGGSVLLPAAELTMLYGRGPEYRLKERKVTIPDKDAVIEVDLERWVNPMDHGFYSGDHHIHAAGCAHYTKPTEGVHAADMFLHVKGEGLNVGCNLTWGPCYDYQRQFFQPGIDKLSEPMTLLKYDVEVSGFGSQALGHVCLLNLKDQTYPGSEGTSTKGWPTWTTPLMKWAKKQGAVTGYAHSANGLGVRPDRAAKRLVDDVEKKSADLVLPEDVAAIDEDKNGTLSLEELQRSVQRVMNRLPNLAVPEMDGIGAQEICVTAAQGICDFISAMDTQRVPEWNCWYHIMNCGFPLKVSGETDFPCISGSRVGEGRVYVQLGKVDKIDFTAWCEGLRAGRSYVSDGYAHALKFAVEGKSPGEEVRAEGPMGAKVRATVSFAAAIPLGTAKGGTVSGTERRVELVVNGAVADSKVVPADDKEHEVSFDLKVGKSSWVALRSFPQMHTNPVNVIVAGKPIRASKKSALWCIAVIEQLWRVRGNGIAAHEREEARKTFEWAIEKYRTIAAESTD